MKLGDLVEYDDKRWKVSKHDRHLAICLLLNFAGETVEVPDDFEGVVASPSEDWPFVALPSKAGGPIREVLRGGKPLQPLVDWAPSNLLRYGGSIFFNPDLKLRRGEVLVGVQEGGRRIRINITHAFGTVSRRIQRSKPKVREAPTAFDRLLDNDLFGDED